MAQQNFPFGFREELAEDLTDVDMIGGGATNSVLPGDKQRKFSLLRLRNWLANFFSKNVDSIVDLEALTGTKEGQVIKMTGYYAGVPLADMPDYHVFPNSVKTPTGGNVIARPDGGNFEWGEVRILDCKFFGAKYDGITSDSLAIQNMFTYGMSLPIMPSIYFSNGVYSVTTTLTITGKDAVKIYSDNAIIQNDINNGAAAMLSVTNCKNVRIRDLNFVGNSKDLNIMLYLDEIRDNLVIDGNTFEEFNGTMTGLYLSNIGQSDGNYQSATFSITNNSFQNYTINSPYPETNPERAGGAIYLGEWSEYGIINSNKFFNMHTAITSAGGANCTISSNTFYCCGTSTLHVINFTNSAANYGKNIIASNHFNHNSGTCIRWAGGATGLTIANNDFLVNKWTVLALTGAEYHIITNNNFLAFSEPVNTAFMILSATNAIMISGNQFQGFSGGITSAIITRVGADNTVVTGNGYTDVTFTTTVDVTSFITNNFAYV